MSQRKIDPWALTGITCPACLKRLEACPVNEHGHPLAAEVYAVGNMARTNMGHAMYHTADGRTALCAAGPPKKPA